jgi:SAM-dependent methyltransferase
MKADFEDYLIDAKLHIDTVGRNDSFSTDHLYPYEPTSYPVLDRLIESGYIADADQVLDYGCGKGRVPIYLNYKLGCRTIGVELVDGFFDDAVKNVEKYMKSAG